jgi:hypothetical protein
MVQLPGLGGSTALSVIDSCPNIKIKDRSRCPQRWGWRWQRYWRFARREPLITADVAGLEKLEKMPAKYKRFEAAMKEAANLGGPKKETAPAGGGKSWGQHFLGREAAKTRPAYAICDHKD